MNNSSAISGQNPFGIYIHWPYCTHICPYCDFNIYRARGKDSAALIDAILKEIEYWQNQTNQRKISSLYFGGGTPSLLDAKDIAQIIEKIDNLWGFTQSPEITLEANPNDGEIEKFSSFKAAGIERLSLGVQSFSDLGLKELGRFHSADDSLRAANIARKIFERLSIDLIYARQNQTIADWTKELEIANHTDADHISPYSLTIEPNTAFAKKHARGALKIPDQDYAAQFYETTQSALNKYGFTQYEISNHARNNNAISRHNMLYWQNHDWLGIGPGSHGRISNVINGEPKRRAIINILSPEKYIDAVLANGNAIFENEILSPEELQSEYYLMGLRLRTGTKIRHDLLPLNQNKMAEFAQGGYLIIDNDKLTLTDKGRIISNYIIGELLD